MELQLEIQVLYPKNMEEVTNVYRSVFIREPILDKGLFYRIKILVIVVLFQVNLAT